MGGLPFMMVVGDSEPSKAEARIAELEAALGGLLDGLDDYWVTLPEGKSAVEAAQAALKPKA